MPIQNKNDTTINHVTTKSKNYKPTATTATTTTTKKQATTNDDQKTRQLPKTLGMTMTSSNWIFDKYMLHAIIKGARPSELQVFSYVCGCQVLLFLYFFIIHIVFFLLASFLYEQKGGNDHFIYVAPSEPNMFCWSVSATLACVKDHVHLLRWISNVHVASAPQWTHKSPMKISTCRFSSGRIIQI